VFRMLAVADGEDLTTPLDYVHHPVGTGIKHVVGSPGYAHGLPETPLPVPSFAKQDVPLTSLRERKKLEH